MNKTKEISKAIDEGTLLERVITEDTYIPSAPPEEQAEWKKIWDSGAPQRAREKADSKLVKDLLVKGTAKERYDASDSIIALLYQVGIHDIGLNGRQAAKLDAGEFDSLGAVADASWEELEQRVEKGTVKQLRAALKAYHVDILHQHEIDNLPEAERLRREYRKLSHLHEEAKSGREYYERQYDELVSTVQSPLNRLRRQKKGEARDMLKHDPQGLAELLGMMRYGGEAYGCDLCEILRLAEWGGCRQNYDTCRDCVDSYLEAYYTRGDWRKEKYIEEGEKTGKETAYQCYAETGSRKTLNGTWLYRNFLEFRSRKSYLIPIEYYPADGEEGESVFFRDHDEETDIIYVYVVSESKFLFTAIDAGGKQQVVPSFLEKQKADVHYSAERWFDCLDAKIWALILENRPESAKLAGSFREQVMTLSEKQSGD